MPRVLHPDAVLTVALADEWDTLLATGLATRAAIVANEQALDALFEAGRAGETLPDLLGDGRPRLPEDCAWPHGIVPPSIERRPGRGRPNRSNHDRRPPATRVHPSATARIPEMAEADGRVTARKQLKKDRDRAFLMVNRLTFELLYPANLRLERGRGVDVPGDGRVKEFSAIQWPPGVQIMEHRGFR